jgi:Uma2 family endonuclease
MATVTATGERLLTVEEYAQMPDNGAPSELVRGRVVTLNPPYPYHGFVCVNAVKILGAFVDPRELGYLLSNDSGVVTERDPDTLRGADVAFYSYARVPKGTLLHRGYLAVAPNLVIEVRSPDDAWSEILTKVAEYLRVGVQVVCVLDPQRSSATVYRPDQPEVTLNEDQELTLSDVLPGFSVLVRRFFE